MTSFAFFTGVNPNQSLTTQQTGYIGRDAIINGYVNCSGANIDLRIDGLIYNNGSTLNMNGYDFTVFIGKTGSIHSVVYQTDYYAAIDFIVENGAGAGIGRLFNAGEISGNVMAIYARAVDGDDVGRISNSGTLWGETDGIHLTGLGKIVIANSGLIEGSRIGISNKFNSFIGSAQLVLTNTGVIRGGEASIQVGDAADKVVNLGRLEGEVRLGDGADILRNWGQIDGVVDLGLGADLYNGRKGEALESVLGNDGNDRFIGNTAEADVFDGGVGSDTLDFRQQGAAVVALDDTFGNAGSALGDTYTGFEVIWGSLSGGDKLRGDAQANGLYGYGGNDAIDGAQGNDTIRGGTGADTLTGGLGNDTFWFGNLAEFGDAITDFNSTGGGNDDRLIFNASGLGGGLVAGTLAGTAFGTGTDLATMDATDRFFFRTTDKTLWFDVDGNVATNAAVMVADLQASATMTAADIVLI